MESYFDEALEAILDEENSDVIVLQGEKGIIEFEQIALIPQEEKLYVILKPIQPMEGLGEDEGLVFFINEEKKIFELVADEKIIDDVFDVYFDLVDDEGSEGDE